MPEEDGPGFSFVDKRGTGSDDLSGEPEPPQAGSSEHPVGGQFSSETEPASPFQVPHLSATDRIAFCINWLSEGAWVALGLVRDPSTEKIEQDLEGARTLIDAVGYLVSKAEPGIDENGRRELRNLVRDLQMNFVQQQNRSA